MGAGWNQQRGGEKRDQAPAPLTKEAAKEIAQAINGAIGLALAKLTGSYGDRPEHKPTRLESTTDPAASPRPGEVGIPLSTLPTAWGETEFEKLYQAIKRRLIDECRVDPILLHLLTTAAPELRIDIEPSVIELTGNTLRGRLARLIGSGFFDQPRTQADANRELKRTGPEAHSGRLSEAFAALVNEDRALTREGDGYQKAPGVKVTENRLTA